jgi:N-acetylglucosamine kinase-like BadF-type ATPase
MIVIESGGTKSTWVFETESDEIQAKETVGLHPQELSVDKENVIRSLINDNNLKSETVYFYGAGCESPEAKVKITLFLEDLGLNVIQVQTDIYAACLAQLGNKKGVVGIIGTGAVAAKFDGEKVVQQTSGLGYLLGDEGSGYDIGKRLLQAYFKGELSLGIKESIEAYFHHKSILHRIHEPDGRMCIAGLTKIVRQFSSEQSVKQILAAAFSDFCESALNPFHTNSLIHFVGSVAYFFKDELAEAIRKAGFEMGEVKKVAVFGVFDFLSSENKG